MLEDEKLILDSLKQKSERCIKKYPSLYINILNFSNSELSFLNKVYNYYNNISSPVLCKVCDNKVSFFNNKYCTYCSTACQSSDPELIEMKKSIMIEKYGYISPFSRKDVHEKSKITNLERYGFEKASKSQIVKDKITKTKISLSRDEKLEINKKRIATNLDRYDVDNVSKCENFKLCLVKTNNERYGFDYPMMNKDVSKKRRDNYLEKTGKSHHFHFQEIVNKMQDSRIKTLKDKYLSKISSLGFDVISYKDSILSISCENCNSNFDIITYVLYQRLSEKSTICTICNPLDNKISSNHRDMCDILDEYNIEYELNNRSILSGKELDIYLPNFNLAIEFNGLYWHSEIYKSRNYHLNKTNSCKNLGVDLIHIFQDDWIYRKNICVSVILNKIGIFNSKIYARQCDIREVNSLSDVKGFLDKNHIQGFSNSKINIGLYFNGELVSLMTFGVRNTNRNKEFELIRFCSKINTLVIGGASKLFRYFVGNYEFDEIISYSDISLFSGNLYSNLGFIFSHQSPPNYFWVVDGIRKHRFNYNKKKLQKMGCDISKTEVEIMHEIGHYRIWGCGQKKWIYTKGSC